MRSLLRFLCCLPLVGGLGCCAKSQRPAVVNKVAVEQLTPGRDGPVLYVLAHQDDEILSLTKIIQELKHGTAVHVVWITDGGKSADPAKREAESRTAMQRLGVPEANLHFLRFPDTRAAEHLPEAYAAALAVADAQAVAQICSPAYEGGNIDHDAANLVAAAVASHARTRPVHVEYPLYNRHQDRRRVGLFLPGSGAPEFYIAIDEPTQKLAADVAKVYASQKTALWFMGFVADKEFLLANGLPYRVAPPHDYLKRPIDEKTDYERSMFHRASFDDWQQHAGAFLNGVNGVVSP